RLFSLAPATPQRGNTRRIRGALKGPRDAAGVHTMADDRDTHVRCRHCAAILPGWLPWAHAPHASILVAHLQHRHPAAFSQMLQRMATEDIEAVVMEAFERLEAAEVTARLMASISAEDLRALIDAV